MRLNDSYKLREKKPKLTVRYWGGYDNSEVSFRADSLEEVRRLFVKLVGYWPTLTKATVYEEYYV